MDDTTRLAELAADYFQQYLTTEPLAATMLGIRGYDHLVPDPSRAAAERHILALDAVAERLNGIDRDRLEPADWVTADVLARSLRDQQATLRAGLTEVSVSASVMGRFSETIAAVPKVKLVDVDAAEDYLRRLSALGGYFDALVERHRVAAAEGRTPTSNGVRQAIRQLDDYLATGADDDPFLAPAPPAGLDEAAWRDQVRQILTDSLRPGLLRYRDSLSTDLLPVARDDDHVGVCHVPGGDEGYLAEVAAQTTTDLTPEEIHRLGTNLVAQLREEFSEIGSRALGTADVSEILHRLPNDPALRFETSEQIVDFVTEALRRAEATLSEWFQPYDIAPCVVEQMTEVEAKGGVLGYYMPPATDGSRPGVHCVNAYDPTSRPRFEYEALAFHESVPGHHLQIAVAQSLTGLPDFRRFMFVNAHAEGWGLYTERLCAEMGLYTSDLTKLGMLSFDAWRACRLVVDTGMHAMGWSRDRAIAFMRENTALSDSNIVNEVDRYIAAPGQALGYMVGRIRIRELRERARTELGSGFDIRAFHDVVIGNGNVPLDTLTALVERWIGTVKSG